MLNCLQFHGYYYLCNMYRNLNTWHRLIVFKKSRKIKDLFRQNVYFTGIHFLSFKQKKLSIFEKTKKKNVQHLIAAVDWSFLSFTMDTTTKFQDLYTFECKNEKKSMYITHLSIFVIHTIKLLVIFFVTNLVENVKNIQWLFFSSKLSLLYLEIEFF